MVDPLLNYGFWGGSSYGDSVLSFGVMVSWGWNGGVGYITFDGLGLESVPAR